jgi:hypothetical protein
MDELSSMGDEKNPISLADTILDNGRRNGRLARTARSNE